MDSDIKNLLIPETRFSVSFVIAQMDISTSQEWHALIGKYSGPINCKIETLAGKGYLSSINRLVFTFLGGEEFRAVLKVPSSDFIGSLEGNDSKQMMQDMAERLMKCHNHEVIFYTKISRFFNDLSFGKFLARVFAAKTCDDTTQLGNGFLLMEDLGTRGHHFDFSADQGLSYEQVTSIITPLAEFHARSLSLPRELIDQMESDVHPWSGFKEKLNELGNMLRNLPDQIGEFFKQNSFYLEELLNAGAQHIEDFFMGLHKKVGIPPTLTHGDLWSNNFLLDGTGHGSKISIIFDWQFAHCDTGLNDIAHVLLTSVDGSVRRKHEEEWLRLYLENFKRTLASDIECPFRDFSHLKQIYRKHFYPELIYQMVVLTTFLAENGNDPARNVECKRMITTFEDLRHECQRNCAVLLSNDQQKQQKTNGSSTIVTNGIIASTQNKLPLKN